VSACPPTVKQHAANQPVPDESSRQVYSVALEQDGPLPTARLSAMRRSGLSIPSRVNAAATAKTYGYPMCYVRNISVPPKRTIHHSKFEPISSRDPSPMAGDYSIRLITFARASAVSGYLLYQSIKYGSMFY
jgi:hypothetical protein